MKTICLSLLIALTFFSCKKDNTETTYGIKCNINGVPKTFNILMNALREEDNGFKGVFIQGMNNGSSEEYFAGMISNMPSLKEIAAGTYTDASTDYELLFTYALGFSGPEYEAGRTLYEEAQYRGVSISNPLKVTITSISNDVIKGTFNGDFYFEADPNAEKKSITNGEFALKFQ
jgi:hypothetical protein